MQPYGTRLKDHFQSELNALVEDAAVFAQSYPAEAESLQLGKSGSSDPQVRMLMQSFAFLTGRVRNEMEVAKAHIPNALLQHLQPQLAAPLPSMMVAHIDVRRDVPPRAVLERDRQVIGYALDDAGQRRPCRLRTTLDTPLLPLRVRQVELRAVDSASDLPDNAKAVLKLSIESRGLVPTSMMGIERLRFYIDASQRHAHYLYEQLSLRFVGALVEGQLQRDCELSWLGFAGNEACLPARAHAHPGHRLLQEYFAFPEKFMFFELGPLSLGSVTGDFELELLLDAPIDGQRQLTNTLLRLNCVPLVNLFQQRIDPMPLNHARFEYPLRADVENHRYCEVHSIEELTTIRPDGSLRELRPYFEMESLLHQHHHEHFYALRLERSQLGNVAGTEAHVSFLDAGQQLVQPSAEILAGRALCTNRRLPERLRPGQPLQLEGPGPVLGLELISKPTAHGTPVLTGRRPWTLVSLLALNHLSLADGAKALGTLKQALLAYVGPAGVEGVKHIDALTDLQCRPMVRHCFRNGSRSFFHGLEITLRMDREAFSNGSALLFAAVLRHFLALYAAVNTVVEVRYESTSRRDALKVWPLLAGAQIVL
ncbi:type VI secretion system baseplate subunit TssF [Burkholderiaceae bacterium UC74_6]